MRGRLTVVSMARVSLEPLNRSYPNRMATRLCRTVDSRKEDDSMLTVTSLAGAHLTDLLDGEAEDAVWRLVRRDRRLRLRKGHIHQDDRTFAHNGRVVLATDERIFAALSTRKIDVRLTEKGPRLKLQSTKV